MSSNPVPVSVFNANIIPVYVVVNNGAQFNVSGASSPTYSPGSNTTAVSFGSSPAPGVLGPGNNFVVLTPDGALNPMTFTMTIPSTITILSLQLYVFWASSTSVSWLLLNSGQPIAMDFSPPLA